MSDQPPPKFDIPKRRWDIDWLRVLVVFMLIPYHAARIFDFDPFYIKNDELTTAFSYLLVSLGDAFAMRLLFLLAGAATWFALRKRSGGQYAKERVQRLLIPFIWGLFILVPPITYFALRDHTGYAGSFIEFYPHFFEVGEGGIFLDFAGGFTFAHLWFILLLFTCSLLALPILVLLKRDSGKRAISWLASISGLGILILAGALPGFFEWRFVLTQNPIFPLLEVLIFFIFGFVLMADDRFGEAIDKFRVMWLIVGPILYLVLGVLRIFVELPEWLTFSYYHLIFPWFFILAILAYGKRYLSFKDGASLSDKFLLYFGEAGYSFYLLHMTVLITIGYFVIQWNTSIAIKYTLIVVTTYIGTTAVYELLVRRFNGMRFLFGMRPKRQMPVTNSDREQS